MCRQFVFMRHIFFDTITSKLHIYTFLSSFFTISASYVTGPIPESTRQRHAPLYGRLVAEEHLPASHRDVHQVSTLFS